MWRARFPSSKLAAARSAVSLSSNSKMMGSMATATTHRVDWRLLLGQRAFRFFFTAMFVSLFGSGMNFIGVSWYIMSATHSTVAVSWQVIVVTLPGAGGAVPGWRADRPLRPALPRRAAGSGARLCRFGDFVHRMARSSAALASLLHDADHRNRLDAIWANVNALVQEVIPPSQFTGANATVLVGVQTGMLLAGTFVGFMYDPRGNRRHFVY